MDSPAGQALSFEQVQKLCGVLNEPIDIHPHNNFPTLSISPANLVGIVKKRLLDKDIVIRDVRLNGSAASHCLCEEREDLPQIHFNDVDLIFGVSIEREYDFHVIKEEVLTSLLEFFPQDAATERISSPLLEETYVRKMVLVTNRDNRWSLISLGDGVNKSIELKFVSTMKRQFEFTVDSFQIILDSFFSFGQCSVSMTQFFFPTVQAISVYRDFSEALDHLNNRLISTEAPEEIRGGGLLKYCSLLVNGFQPADPTGIERLESYMCSRFFIDFPSADAQHHKLLKYVQPRLCSRGEIAWCVEFLNVLYDVVSSRAKCLMESERHRTITVIVQLRNWILIAFQFGVPPMSVFPFGPPPHGPPLTPPFIHMQFGLGPRRIPPFYPPQWLGAPVPAQVR